MRSRRLLFVLLFAWLPGALGQYRTALPGYRYEFPRDHFNHPEFQTEWWYTTGNLIAADGHHYGFELTFFRQGVDGDSGKGDPGKKEPWDIQDLYVAHLALSDLDGAKFYHMERTNRAGPGLAGIDEKQKRIWNGNWRGSGNGDGRGDGERGGRGLMCVVLTRIHQQFGPVTRKSAILNQKTIGAGLRASWSLTHAEWRAVQGLAKGKRAADIATAQGISVHTIRTHLKRAMAKARVHSQIALVARVFSARR